MVLVAFQPEVRGLNLLQPFRFVLAGHRIVGDAVRQHQLGGCKGLAFELLLQHVQVVFVDVGITDELGKPARCVATQAPHQVQQRGAFGQVEGGAQTGSPAKLCTKH